MKKYFLLLLLSFLAFSCSKKDELKYKNPNVPIEERVKDLLGRMTLEEKIAQIRHIHSYYVLTDNKLDTAKLREFTGDKAAGFVEAFSLSTEECVDYMYQVQKYMVEKTRLGIPIITLGESLHGVVQEGGTIFPQSISLGSTFEPELAYQMTAAIAAELKAIGIHQTLSPNIDVIRDLRWGRGEETFGEDPYLVSIIGYNQVKGYLDNNISPMIKHFGAHSNPTSGLNLASVQAGKRELLSLYLKPFEYIVKEAKPWAVMSSYNSWNEEPNSGSHYLMTELLRDQWGFQGYVYSDWGAIGMLNYFHRVAKNRAECAYIALTAGLDAEASDDSYSELQNMVEKGYLDVKYIDLAVSRVLRAKFAMGMFENPYPTGDFKNVHNQAHIDLARKIADEAIVLVKNEDNILPLDLTKIRSIAVVGPNADQVQFGGYTWSRSNNDGVTLLNALKTNYADRVKINYAKGCDLATDNKSGFAEAVNAARASDVTVVVVGSASSSLVRDYNQVTSGEGYDLNSLELTGVQEDLIKAIKATNKPVIVVLLGGKAFAIPWVKENIKGIVVQWYPGEQGGNALADMLFGKVNPSGKLTVSFPQSTGHLPVYYNYLPTDKGFYRRPGKPNEPGRDYVFSSPEALWAFGHGLSYSQFEYLSAELSKEDYKFGDTIEVKVKIKNNSQVDGKEVVQVYVNDVYSSVVTPVQELKGFKKVLIKAGETQDVTIQIPVKSLSLFDKDYKEVVEPGAFEIQVGSASNDIRIKKMITVEKDKEVTIPVKEDPKNPNKPANTLLSRVTVKGLIHDVQGNLIKDATIRVKTKSVQSDTKGTYTIGAMSNDTLFVSAPSFNEQAIKIDGRQVINVSMTTK